ncbi:TIGR04283 family arsenosugar biosynthesis glycosyltransferase [Maridesulfovibrio frigidus]|uniref:TIGR04283 family arsenosugar biosynthesis glycosyltransferase n=1 Tax=Maridesulfovibrio frigidus TaxID=340956 RepID=UPI0004E21702|nr:TIGR04283 family arsenosugar biosynthesis glycosyltransferase [Maridesulfovibrio frigidus]
MSTKATLSIIIPVFNEQLLINTCINSIKANLGSDHEIIVVDGSPDSSTIASINDKSIICVSSSAGRAIQMNTGAMIATGDILVFLHADTTFPPNSASLIREALTPPEVVAGAFKLSFDDKSFLSKLIAYMANIRTALERVPYGDQAPFIDKDTFITIGGFPLIPIMEDVELFQDIKKRKLKIILLQETVTTSARRFKQTGMICGFLRNWLLRILHTFGVSPINLKKMYKNHGDRR